MTPDSLDESTTPRGLLGWIGVYLRGMAMGVAELVPGVSGGTIAFITGIYVELVRTIRKLDPALAMDLLKGRVGGAWREGNLGFLAALGVGMATSVFGLAALVFALVIEGVAAGATTIEAEAGDVVGALRMRVVAAELDTIEGLLDDPYTRALVAALGDDARAALEALLVSCVEALEEGHMLNLARCLEDIREESGEEPTDQALLAVIGIVTTATEQFLGF